jgi:hypothetical protein
MALVELVRGVDKAGPGVLAGIALFFGGAAAACGYLSYRMLRKPAMSAFDREQAILAAASARGGRITVAGVASVCRIPLKEAKATIEAMCQSGFAEVQITDDGSIEYELRGVLPVRSAANAEALAKGRAVAVQNETAAD